MDARQTRVDHKSSHCVHCELIKVFFIVDGVLSGWLEWTPCSKSCAGGTRSRNRTCDFPPDAPRGTGCNATLTDSQDCNTEKCPGIDDY